MPSRLPFGNEAGDFELESAVPIKRIVALIKPTDPAAARGQGLPVAPDFAAFAELSVAGGGRPGSAAGDSAALQLHRLHVFGKANRGAYRLDSNRHFARVVSEDGVTFARGTQVEMEFDEEQFTGAGVYLFASVMEQFLGMYVP